MKRGLSLMETVLSCFLLVGLITLAIHLFHAALRHSVLVEQRLRGIMLAQEQLESVRQQAADAAGFDRLRDWDGRRVTRDGVELVTAVRARPLFSPSSPMEQGEAAPRQMRASVYEVEVLARWGPRGVDSGRLVTLVPDPGRTPGRLAVTPATPVPSQLPPGQGQVYRLQLLDATGHEIPDVTFHVSSEPSGRAFAESDRDGRTATLANRVYRMDGTWTTTGGPARLHCWARYRGLEITGDSLPLEMGSP